MSRLRGLVALGCLALVAPISGAFAQAAVAGDATAKPAAPACDPYKDYSCFDDSLGKGFWERLTNYYAVEWGQSGPPADPKAPPGRIESWPPTPETTPPMPFTEWPYGGSTLLGVNRPAAVDSPLMVALGNTGIGSALAASNIQVYGWIDVGGNLSTSTTPQGGNAPAAYDYRPGTLQLDQLVLYAERTPDTVQTDHNDWGFRFSVLYGENYRYTTAYGLLSDQLLTHNNENGIDFPMLYGEYYILKVADGLMIRVGRYISLPDIEAQLAPNNYMYTHSMTYSFDNYTNTGIQTTLALTQQLFLQVGLSAGTESTLGHLNQRIPNPYPNQLYPDSTFKKDPGAMPSGTLCLRYNTKTGNDDVNLCANGINKGTWGYNNLQWYGLTYYHKWSDKWHVSFESYYEHQNDVPNATNPVVQNINANGGTPFTAPAARILFNAPDEALCSSSTVLTCTAKAYGTVAYFNYSPDPLNNFSIRPEFYWDPQGQRTGAATRYITFSLGWQHWWSPQLEARPEIAYYRSLNANAFNGNANAGIAPDSAHQIVVSGDVIFHF
jgi:hypothetical protein